MSPQRKKKLNQATKHILKVDPSIKSWIQKIGECKWEPIGSPYFVLIKSILGQQISVKAAEKMESRWKDKIGISNLENYDQMLTLSSSDWREIGLSQTKMETIQRVSQAYSEGLLSDELLVTLSDKEVIQNLCSYKGIGPWTAEMVLIFGLDRWDHFSMGDLILRRGIQKWTGILENDKKKIQEYTEQFSPYRTILSWYLWADFDGGAGGWS